MSHLIFLVMQCLILETSAVSLSMLGAAPFINWRMWYLSVVWLLAAVSMSSLLFFIPLIIDAILQGTFAGGLQTASYTGRAQARTLCICLTAQATHQSQAAPCVTKCLNRIWSAAQCPSIHLPLQMQVLGALLVCPCVSCRDIFNMVRSTIRHCDTHSS